MGHIWSKINKRNSWYKLSEILAILSGTWIVASGIFITLASNSLFQQQNQISISQQAILANNPEIVSLSNQTVSSLSKIVVNSVELFKFLFYVGIVLGILSLVFWFLGTIKDN